MKFKLALGLFILSTAASANTGRPAELIFLGKPIDPLCIYDAQSPSGVISLKSCGIGSLTNEKITGYNKQLQALGYTGYDYSHAGSAYYKPVAQLGKSWIVYSLNSGGGSGQFSTLYLIDREGDSLRFQNIESGDRCNGGIFDVKQEKNKLVYRMNLTAYDFLSLANNDPHHIKAIHDLDGCAACCYATAVFERDLGKDFLNPTLDYVDISAPIPKNPSSALYQQCFNNLINNEKKIGKKTLTPQELKIFTTDFNLQCIKIKK